MPKKRTLAIAAILIAGGAAIAVSAPGHRLHGGLMDRWAHGGDRFEMGPGLGLGGGWHGTITREQFDEKVRERFARLDANSDGVIDAAEIEAALAKGTKHHRERRAARFGEDRGEAGRSRSITKSEFLDEMRRRFAQADLDGDGKITDADLPPIMRGRGILSGEQGFGRHDHGRRGSEGRRGTLRPHGSDQGRHSRPR
jgi:Ca2+-binding EF-hand superfamily protein